ncbi:MAG: tetratricopeptide repeat protein, partial [Bacteroidetes bacterium]|nr:tetratricopeptide repeat protein [Bacteroidota bacterium]
YTLFILINRSTPYNPRNIYLLGSFFIILLIFFGVGTYTRNFDWKTNKSLLVDNFYKAPNQSRSYHNLASYLLNEEKAVDDALFLYNTALTKQTPTKHGPRYRTYMAIANIHISFKNDHSTAIPIIKKAIAEVPYTLTARKKLVIALIKTGSYNEAEKYIEKLLAKRGRNYTLKDNEKITRQHLLNLKALVALKQNSFPTAFTAAREALTLKPDDHFALANIGHALCKLGKYEQANHYLTKLLTIQIKPNLLSFFLLLENSLLQNNDTKAHKIARDIITSFPLKDIFSTILVLDKPAMAQPIDVQLLQTYLLEIVFALDAQEDLGVQLYNGPHK